MENSEGGFGGLYDGFEAYQTTTEAEYRRLLTDGLVVPDTNVFLNLYRYNDQTRDDLFAVLRGLGDRLWVPRQVMVEFWRNRETVLQDPRDTDRTVKELAALRTESVNAFQAWANRVGLPEARRKELVGVFSHAFQTVITGVGELADKDVSQFRSDTTKDPVLSGLEPILHGRVGLELDENEHRKALVEAKRRSDTKEPPGYKDFGKQGVGPVGDYLIWVQTLQEARRRQQDVLLVTGDVKEDWWRRERGELRGPRPELAEEMRKVAGTRLFMVRPESLLLHARQILRVEVSDESVQDIERVAEAEEEAAVLRDAMIIDNDHPMWSLHSGGSRHDAPDWGPGDEHLAETQSELPPLTAVFHRVLVERPGQILSVEDLARITDGELSNARVIAGALSGYVNWCERLNRRFPFYWWEGRNGESTRYAMQPKVAALFQAVGSDTFMREEGHLSRCDDPGSIEAVRCPSCKGKGKVPYTFGYCTECGGKGTVLGCFKHRAYWKMGP